MQYKPLILKNYMASTLVELVSIPLAAPLARARNKFILLFQETVKQVENERQALLMKYGDLDTEGKLQVGSDGNYKLKDAVAFAKEFEEMTSRALAITCNGDELKGTFLMVKNILDNLETKLTVAQTTVYSEIMDAFEAWAAPEAVGGSGGEGITATDHA